MDNHIQISYNSLINKVKLYKKNLSRENKEITEKIRLYPFVQQKKFYYGDEQIIQLLCDSLARVSNSVYSSNNSINDGLSKVLAIYFETSEKPGNSRNFQTFLLN
jgi:hypothetical protein